MDPTCTPDPQTPLAAHKIWRVTAAGVEPDDGDLPREEALAVEIDGRTVAALMRTPGAEKALALGYCLSEGLVRSLSDVLLVHHCGSGEDDELFPPPAEGESGPRHRVRIRLTPEAAARLDPQQPTRWVFSGCNGVDVAALGDELRVGKPELRVDREVILGIPPAMVGAQEEYRSTGGIHAAAFFDLQGQMLVLREDVGRHNAVDKAIGELALQRRPLGDILVATGRASSDIIAKAARMGIPIVASFSSSTSLGVSLAEAAGITLIGYLRRNRFTVFTHCERIAVS
jgi:FdhD protein